MNDNPRSVAPVDIYEKIARKARAFDDPAVSTDDLAVLRYVYAGLEVGRQTVTLQKCSEATGLDLVACQASMEKLTAARYFTLTFGVND